MPSWKPASEGSRFEGAARSSLEIPLADLEPGKRRAGMQGWEAECRVAAHRPGHALGTPRRLECAELVRKYAGRNSPSGTFGEKGSADNRHARRQADAVAKRRPRRAMRWTS